jgi:hypothetical protein
MRTENPLSLYKTLDLVKELISRDSVEWNKIDKGDQFSYQIANETIDFTNHMPRTILILVDVVEMEKEE